MTALGTQVAFVHMQPADEAATWLARYGLADVPSFSDPTHALYRAFDLREAGLRELGHPRVWKRWLQVAISRGAGWQGAHWRQLSGAFVVHGNAVLAAIRYPNSAARPDYLTFVRSALHEG